MKRAKQSERSESETTAVNIRDFPVDLLRRSKAHAALRGITLRQLVIEALERILKEEK
jgi:hypothetical protein